MEWDHLIDPGRKWGKEGLLDPAQAPAKGPVSVVGLIKQTLEQQLPLKAAQFPDGSEMRGQVLANDKDIQRRNGKPKSSAWSSMGSRVHSLVV